MVAITKANNDNGCLQVIKGSHKIGRIDHGFAGEQVGASHHHVDLALETMDLVYVELQPGDALFFHSNLLHRSEANLSDKSRWSFRWKSYQTMLCPLQLQAVWPRTTPSLQKKKTSV